MTMSKISKRLLSVHELPSWMRDNDFLRASYRPPQPSIKACLQTGLFTLSNDTVNIYTHGLGFFALLPAALFLLRRVPLQPVLDSLPVCTSVVPSLADLRQTGLGGACVPDGDAVASSIAALFDSHRHAFVPLLLTAMLCLAFSTLYHTFWVLSPRACARLASLDFVGIVLLCAGHALTGTYHAFYCHPLMAARYYPYIMLAAALCIPVIVTPTFATPAARPLRGLLFSGLGCVSLFPLFQAAFYVKAPTDQVAVFGSLLTLLIYGIGAFAYVVRFPECCRVGYHDKFFASHQLLHVAVLTGVATHLIVCYYCFQYRIENGCTLSV